MESLKTLISWFFDTVYNVPELIRAVGFFGLVAIVFAETGLLVVRAPDDSRLKLEDGDVIVDIDGRTPSSPSRALRILSSYQPGEKLKLNVLRAKKRMSFEITVPEDATWEKRIDGAHLERRLERGLRHGPVIKTMPGTPGFHVEGPGPISIPAPPLPDEPV